MCAPGIQLSQDKAHALELRDRKLNGSQAYSAIIGGKDPIKIIEKVAQACGEVRSSHGK